MFAAEETWNFLPRSTRSTRMGGVGVQKSKTSKRDYPRLPAITRGWVRLPAVDDGGGTNLGDRGRRRLLPRTFPPPYLGGYEMLPPPARGVPGRDVVTLSLKARILRF